MTGMLTVSAGCSGGVGFQNEQQQQQQMTKQSTQQNQSVLQMDRAKKAEQIAKGVNGVDQATAVSVDKQLSLAVKVTNFQRLRLKQIRREVHRKLTEQFPGIEIHVTSDNKLFREIENLASQIDEGRLTNTKSIKKQVEKINKDMKG